MEMISAVVNATEKTIRYFLPGIWICILIILSGDDSTCTLFNGGDKPGIFLIIIGVGPIVYTMYRQILDVIEHVLVNRWDIKSLTKIFRFDYPKEKFNEYLNFKFAQAHIGILIPMISIFAIKLFQLQIFKFENERCLFFAMNIAFLISGIINYIILTQIKRFAFDEANK